MNGHREGESLMINKTYISGNLVPLMYGCWYLGAEVFLIPQVNKSRKGLISMAGGRKGRNSSTQRQRASYHHEYVYGNAVSLPDYHPEVLPQEKRDKPLKKRLDPQIKRNRRRAQSLSTGYSAYLLAVSVIVVAICIFYLQLQSENMRRSNNVANLRNQLTEITEQNNNVYQSIIRSIDLEYIRFRAVHEFGMVNMTSDLVIEYQNPNSGYVIIHNEIPITGIVAN
jgi:cell division protein FtsL